MKYIRFWTFLTHSVWVWLTLTGDLRLVFCEYLDKVNHCCVWRGRSGQYCTCWCPGKLCCQVISSNGIGTKPLPEPILTCHQQGLLSFTEGHFLQDMLQKSIANMRLKIINLKFTTTCPRNQGVRWDSTVQWLHSPGYWLHRCVGKCSHSYSGRSCPPRKIVNVPNAVHAPPYRPGLREKRRYESKYQSYQKSLK